MQKETNFDDDFANVTNTCFQGNVLNNIDTLLTFILSDGNVPLLLISLKTIWTII